MTLGVSTRMHFEHCFSPCSILSRKLSPTRSENWSYQTGHIIFISCNAMGSAISAFSRLSWELGLSFAGGARVTGFGGQSPIGRRLLLRARADAKGKAPPG